MKKILSRLFLLAAFTAILAPSFAITLPSSANSPTTSKDSLAALSKEKFDEAMKEFKSLSKHEKKAKFKEVKKALKKYKAEKRSAKAEPSTNTVLLVILAILLPPLAVYLSQGAYKYQVLDKHIAYIMFLGTRDSLCVNSDIVDSSAKIIKVQGVDHLCTFCVYMLQLYCLIQQVCIPGKY